MCNSKSFDFLSRLQDYWPFKTIPTIHLEYDHIVRVGQLVSNIILLRLSSKNQFKTDLWRLKVRVEIVILFFPKRVLNSEIVVLCVFFQNYRSKCNVCHVLIHVTQKRFHTSSGLVRTTTVCLSCVLDENLKYFKPTAIKILYRLNTFSSSHTLPVQRKMYLLTLSASDTRWFT